MVMPVTSLFAALLALVLVVLSFRVIGVRRSEGISLGIGGNPALEQRSRSQANFCEYVPLALLLLAMLEANQVGAGKLYALGVLLLAARICHPFGIEGAGLMYRVIGTSVTFLVLLVEALLLLNRVLAPLFASSEY